LFSIERTENNKHHALRAFKAPKYRVAIDFFSFAILSTAKEKYLYLCALCVFAVEMDTADLLSQLDYLYRSLSLPRAAQPRFIKSSYDFIE
jgi:hypothetical protein